MKKFAAVANFFHFCVYAFVKRFKKRTKCITLIRKK